MWISRLVAVAAAILVLASAWGPVRDAVFIDALGRPAYSHYFSARCDRCGNEGWCKTEDGVFSCKKGHTFRPAPGTAVIQGDGTTIWNPDAQPALANHARSIRRPAETRDAAVSR